MKIVKKYLKIIGKIAFCIILLFTLLIGKISFAVEEVKDGGAIQESVIGTGLMKMVRDLTGTLQWIIPVCGVMVILFYVFKIMTR
ncbi:MAG: hypothetical protein Q4G09_00455 [Clostridia bacterium]|nr:hypothetical protein [Clostridia bacterium]